MLSSRLFRLGPVFALAAFAIVPAAAASEGEATPRPTPSPSPWVTVYASPGEDRCASRPARLRCTDDARARDRLRDADRPRLPRRLRPRR